MVSGAVWTKEKHGIEADVAHVQMKVRHMPRHRHGPSVPHNHAPGHHHHPSPDLMA